MQWHFTFPFLTFQALMIPFYVSMHPSPPTYQPEPEGCFISVPCYIFCRTIPRLCQHSFPKIFSAQVLLPAFFFSKCNPMSLRPPKKHRVAMFLGHPEVSLSFLSLTYSYFCFFCEFRQPSHAYSLPNLVMKLHPISLKSQCSVEFW